MAIVPNLQLARGIIIAAALCGLSAIGQNAPYYGYTNLAGLGGSQGSVDGTNTVARFNQPYSVALDPNGNAFVADSVNHTIRKVTPEGVVTTFAGLAGNQGSTDGTGTNARFSGPQGVATDIAGNVYVCDSGNSAIRKITPNGAVTTLAGLPGTYGSVDGTNTTARFFIPSQLAVDNTGIIYVADFFNNAVRKVTQSGVVTTLAGVLGSSGSADGTNGTARFYRPGSVAVDSDGTVYVADTDNYTIRKVTPGGVVTTLAGLAGASGSVDGTNSTARFTYPYGLAVDTNGNIFVADYRVVRKVTAAGMVTTIGGLASVAGNVDGTNSQARFNQLVGMAIDAAGSLYLSDSRAHRVIKGTPIYPPLPIIGTTDPLPAGTTGMSYSTTLAATGGVTPYTWTIAAGGLPTGLNLSTGGVISGTPTLATNASMTLKVTGANSAYSTKTFTLVVYAPPSITTGSPLPPGITGAPYSQTLAGSGGQLPYTWSLTSGSLPAGLSLSTDGIISGTPTTLGSASFGIALAANNGTGVTNSFTLAINQGVPLTEGFEHAGAIPAGWTQEYVTDTVNWVFQKGGHNNANPANAHSGLFNGLLYSSGTTDHKTKLVTPMIDFGTNTAAQLSFWVDTKIYYLYQDNMAVYYKTNAAAAWTLLGYYEHDGWIQVTYSLPTPTRTYYLGFEGDARGGYGALLDDVSVVAVAPPAAPVILSGNRLLTGTLGTPYSQTLSASGGTAPYTWLLNSGTLPAGLSLSTGGVLSGTPTAAGNASIGISVAGGDSMASTNLFSVAINRTPTATDPNYAFTNFVGQAGSSGSTDSTNSAARFSSPVGVCVDSAGNLFVGDSWNHTIRKITPIGTVTTLAGLAGMSGTNDGVGNAARFYNPAGVAVDTNGLVYVADENNNTIRIVAPGGTVSTLAGTPGHTGINPDDTNNWYYFYEPTGVAAGDGNCYVADTVNNTIAKIMAPSRNISIVAGYYEGSADGTGLNARFTWPQGLALSQGMLYVADTGNKTIRKVTLGGVTTTLAGSPGLSGSTDGTNSAARFMTPYAAAVDLNGNVFVVDRDNHNIRRITPAGVVTTIGGCAGVAGSTDDVGLGARFDSPEGIAVDKDGVLYIADTGNNRIVKGTPVLPAGGILQMVASTATASETNGSVTLYVARTGSTAGTISCTYATADGTATAGADYTATNGILTWLDGDGANKAITVPIINDSTPESSEGFTVSLAGAAVGAPATTAVTITDDDLVTRIVRLAGSLDFGTVTVGQTTNRLATIYNDGNGTLQISSIVCPGDFTASGLGDGSIPSGSNKVITVTFWASTAQAWSGDLTVISDATSGTNTLPITGTAVNPPAGTIQMNTDKASVGEGAGAITVYAYRAGGSFGTLSCTYTTANGTALAGSDYTGVSGTLTWTNGETGNKTFVVPILEDSAIEGDESFSVNLTGTAVNLPASTTITIIDNDFGTAPGITGQPTSSTVNVGATTGFTVSANGTPTLGYQWQKEGTNLAAATGTSLTLAGVQTNQAGNYTVVVTNGWGSTTSRVAVLVVNRLGQTMTFGALTDQRVGNTPFTLAAASSSGLAVSYTSSAQTVATVSGSTVTIVGAGNTTITAKQAGDATYLPAADVSQNLRVVGSTSTVLVQDDFTNSSGSLPDATKFDWAGHLAQTGAGQLNLLTDTYDLSWLKSKAGAAPGAGETLVLQMRAYAYAENWSPGVYGDKQPRGLRVGTDANNAVEFYSVSRVSVGMRCHKAGMETSAAYSLPAGVDSQHDYQISVTTTSVVFKIDGTIAGTITANIPTGVLNVYVDSNDGGGVGNVPVSVDSVALTLNSPTPATPPKITTGGTRFGVQTNRFGFNITGTSGTTFVVDASTNLTSSWSPIWTNTLGSSEAYFGDAQWTNYRGRFYRVRSP